MKMNWKVNLCYFLIILTASVLTISLAVRFTSRCDDRSQRQVLRYRSLDGRQDTPAERGQLTNHEESVT